MQHLQQQLDLKSLDNDRLRNLVSTLSEGTDHDATTLLARLRLGENLEDLLVALAADGSNEEYVLAFCVREYYAWRTLSRN